MQYLVTTYDNGDINWDDQSEILKAEAGHVLSLFSAGSLRNMWFTDKKDAVLIFECDKTCAVWCRILSGFFLWLGMFLAIKASYHALGGGHKWYHVAVIGRAYASLRHAAEPDVMHQGRILNEAKDQHDYSGRQRSGRIGPLL